LIEARLADREHGVEMDMDIGEGRGHEFAGAFDHLTWAPGNLWSDCHPDPSASRGFDFGDEAIVNSDIDVLVVTAYASVAKNQVHCASVRGIVTGGGTSASTAIAG
jgi:hypothetical protein